MVQRVRAVAKRSKWVVVAVSIAKDQRSRWSGRRGAAPSTSGSTHQSFSLDESVGYIDSVFEDYLRVGELEAADLQGKRVLELGPGDNFGVALRFLARGAQRVVCVDKFTTRRDQDQQRRIYEALLTRLDDRARASVADAICLSGPADFNTARLDPIEGVAVEEIADRFDPADFDLVVSRAVLEHLYDLDAAFAAMDRILAPGGLMLHKVDFRDHGIFTGGGMHPLTFLTIPERLYRLMSRHSGQPNRRLIDWYRARLDTLGYDAQLLVTRVVGRREELAYGARQPPIDAVSDRATRELLEAIRPRLQPGYRALADEDLAVAGIFIVARKPEQRPQPTATGAGRSASM